MSKINSVQAMLIKRESWKYADVKKYLDINNIKYDFEFILEDFFIYDLVLHDYRLIIEFDGSSHDTKLSLHDDFEKDMIAEENGYAIERIKIDDNLVIPAEDIVGIISSYNKL